MADKITTNFDAVRALLVSAAATSRSWKGALEIKKSCELLGFSPADTTRIFIFMEYADGNTGAAFGYAKKKTGTVIWDFAAYQADMKAKGK